MLVCRQRRGHQRSIKETSRLEEDIQGKGRFVDPKGSRSAQRHFGAGTVSTVAISVDIAYERVEIWTKY
jgi:hypothetical protein